MSSKGTGRGSGERYDDEFKQEAVRLLLTSGKTATQLSRELGVSSWSLSRWKQDYLQASGEIEVEGQMRSAVEVEQENRQLRRELEAMRRQRDLEVFYNRQRSHSALGYLSPAQFEQQQAAIA